MKKALVILLAGLIALSMAACNNDSDDNSSTPANTSSTQVTESSTAGTESSEAVEDSSDVVEESSEVVEESSEPEAPAAATDPLKVLEDIWNGYEEDQMFFAMGGDAEHMVNNAPGSFVLDADLMENQLLIPAANVEMVDACASLVNAMNLNSFTSAAYHLKNADDAQALATAIRDKIQGNQWMCGFPDNLIVAKIGDCLVSAYGNVDLIEYFKNKLVEVHPSAELLYDEAISY